MRGQHWSGSAGTFAGGLTDYNTATEINEHLWQFSTANLQLLVRAFLVSDGLQQVSLEELSVGCGNLQLESGTVSADEQWVSVDLQHTYVAPVVVASYFEQANSLPASVRIRNVTPGSFEIRLQNPGDQDVAADTVTYLVIEEGVWDLDGLEIEAQRHDTATLGYSNNWTADSVSYRRDWLSAPIVLHQVMSSNNDAWVSTFVSEDSNRTNPPGLTSFWLALNGAEAATSHGLETIGWVALSADQSVTLDGVDAETRRTFDIINGHDNGCNTVNFLQPYATTPGVLAFQQKMDGNDGGWGVVCSASATQLGMHGEEDQQLDSERSHTSEVFAYLAFAQPLNYSTAGGGAGYAASGTLISSAFDAGVNQTGLGTVSWQQSNNCAPNCSVQLQVRSAPDASGSPGTWTDWYGASGVGSFFTDPNETLLPTDLNFNRWLQYQAVLNGDGSATPSLESVNLLYLP